MPDKRILRVREVTRKTGLARSTIYLAASQGKFPQPLKLFGAKASGWLESDIDEWIDSRVAASRGEAK